MTTTSENSKSKYPCLAGFWLFAAIPFSLLIGGTLEMLFKIKFDTNDSTSHVIMFLVHFGVGYLWARSLGRRSGLLDNIGLYLSGALGFSLSFIGMFTFLASFNATFLKYIERFNGAGNLEFGAFFAPWLGIITGVSGLALGLGLRKWKLGLKMFGMGFATGFLIYLAIMFTLQLFGFSVGSGRPVMLPTTFLSLWITALVGSGLFGKLLGEAKPG